MSQNEQGERRQKLEREGEALLIKGRVEQLEREQEESRKRDEEYKKLQIHYNKKVAWFTGGLFATSGILNMVYIDISRTSRNSADAAKNAAEIAKNTLAEMQLEQRPWVTVKDARAEMAIGKEIKGVIVLTNSGKTLALRVQADGALFVSNDPSADLPAIPKGDTTENIDAPGQALDITTFSGDRFGSKMIKDERELARLKQPDVKYYAYGDITYNDTSISRAVHHTEFCYWFTIGTSNLTPCVGKRYQNKAD